MRVRVLCLLVLLASTSGFCQDLPPFDRSKIGKPTPLFGRPLMPAQAKLVDAAGQETTPSLPSAEQAEAQYGGYAAVGVPRGTRLVWTLANDVSGEFHIYFLVRSGHQQGYEYVFPEMSYVAELDGQALELELARETGAVRVYQSKDTWGHDMGWIRTRAPVTLRPGHKLAVGCTEDYAFVALGLLVSEEAHRLTVSLSLVEAMALQIQNARLLADRMAKVFPRMEASCEAARKAWNAAEARIDALRDDLQAAGERVKAGETPKLEPLAARIEALARDLPVAEREARVGLAAALADVHRELIAREAKVRIERPVDFEGREAEYARAVAQTYVQAIDKLAPADKQKDLQRAASYCWRADQFLARAETAAAKASRAPELAQALLPPAPVKLQPAQRTSMLLNGVWEMSWEGSPNAPPNRGWFPIRVPHGPWSETVGAYMALDRKWPSGQAWAWYRTRFVVPNEMAGATVLLHFGAVFHLCEAYVRTANNPWQFAGRHVGGFDKFEFDVTRFINPGQPAELLCFVHDTSYTALDKSDRAGEPTGCSSGPNHYVISDLWGARFGGLWQDVSLRSRPALWADEVLVLPSYRTRKLTVRTRVGSQDAGVASNPKAVVVRQSVLKDGRPVLNLPERRLPLTGGIASDEISKPWPTPDLWGIGGEYGDPRNLYVLRTEVLLPDGDRPLDVRYDRFGFREFWIQDGQFYLNGKRLPLQGGGTWYLQESKIAHGNRWWATRFFGLERSMNVNIERWHRHGDVTDEFFDLTDELGMLNEPEGAYWGVYGIPDILGYSDWDDPVWVKNVTEHYRHWAIKHFNHPSVVLWSVENETFTSAKRPPGMLDRFLAFGEAIKQVDPTRPVTYHGSENGFWATRDSRLEIVNLHYPGDDRVIGWHEKWGGRPCIDGEFQNYPPLFLTSNNDRQVAEQNMQTLQQWIEHKWKHYRDVDLSGSFYFLPYMAGLVSTARPEWMGPWGDLLGDLAKAPVTESGWAKGQANLYAWVSIDWPSLSGPGIKCERLRAGLGHLSLINWFDPTRPEATPTPVAETIARCWQAMPPLREDTAPEVIVTVTYQGKPLPGEAVLAIPAGGQPATPVSAMTDPGGTAWLVLREEGPYQVTCRGKTARWVARRLPRAPKPGWAHIPHLPLALD